MKLKVKRFITALEAAMLLAGTCYAGMPPGCQTGTLLDLQENTDFVPATQIGQARQSKSEKIWNTMATPSARRRTTYVVKVELDGVFYTARSSGEFWNYNPGNLVVNDEVEACVVGNKLVIARPDGKQYKPTIIRRERAQASHAVK